MAITKETAIAICIELLVIGLVAYFAYPLALGAKASLEQQMVRPGVFSWRFLAEWIIPLYTIAFVLIGGAVVVGKLGIKKIFA
jgi:hypothetical protein